MKVNPYKIEYKRQKLAKERDIHNLKNLYSSKLPEIKDLNTSEFWDERFSDKKGLNDQDGITKDRIREASRFIPKDKLKILDIGAGFGFIEELLSKDKNKEIYANDFSQTSVKILKKKFSGHFSLQSIYKLKYKDNFFDVVLVLEVLEHIPPHNIFGVLNSIHKLIKNNGILIVSVPMNEGLEKMKENPSGHVRMYTKELIITELESSGFRVLDHKVFYAFSNMYQFKKIISMAFRNKWKPNNIVIKLEKI